jgi:hypothetical protein
MPMPPIEKARAMHDPSGREPVRDPDLLAWCAALPECVNLAEETQHLRQNHRMLLDWIHELQEERASLKDELDAARETG